MTQERESPAFITADELGKLQPALAGDLLTFVAQGNLLTREQTDIETVLSSLGSRVPATQRGVYSRRLSDIRKQLDQRRRVAEAVGAGYDLYTIPKDFSVGFVDHPSAARLRRLGMWSGALVFNAPIPLRHMSKYLAAKETGLFDEIVVASKDQSLFRQVTVEPRPRSSYVDPFLVGLMGLPDFYGSELRMGMRGDQVSGCQGFLISHWDLSREIGAD